MPSGEPNFIIKEEYKERQNVVVTACYHMSHMASFPFWAGRGRGREGDENFYFFAILLQANGNSL